MVINVLWNLTINCTTLIQICKTSVFLTKQQLITSCKKSYLQNKTVIIFVFFFIIMHCTFVLIENYQNFILFGIVKFTLHWYWEQLTMYWYIYWAFLVPVMILYTYNIQSTGNIHVHIYKNLDPVYLDHCKILSTKFPYGLCVVWHWCWGLIHSSGQEKIRESACWMPLNNSTLMDCKGTSCLLNCVETQHNVPRTKLCRLRTEQCKSFKFHTQSLCSKGNDKDLDKEIMK